MLKYLYKSISNYSYIYFFLHNFYLKYLAVKLNGGRLVVGLLRGFDPFMNMVIDETVEECKDGTKNNIGMVVCYILRSTKEYVGYINRDMVYYNMIFID